MSNIIEQLKSIRRSQGVKQSELGEKLGLPQSHVSKIERGTNDPRLSTVTDMARMLDQEIMLIPRQMMPHICALLRGNEEQDRRFQPNESDDIL
jgi:predicted transcriptional regulator